MHLIQAQADLINLIKQISTTDIIALDTEFMREKTYYPVLCLVQINVGGQIYLVDPLPESLDLTKFWQAVCTKVVILHSARQDFEIIHNTIGQVPTKLFDTQVAASVCGFGDNVAYENIVKKICKVELDKSMCISDWSKRPLSDEQLEYAANDVIHLPEIYNKLQEQLNKQNRHEWIAEQLEELTNNNTYEGNDAQGHKRIKLRKRTDKAVAILQALCIWRDGHARDKNIPRRWFAADETLSDIATKAPTNEDALKKVTRIKKLDKKYHIEIIELVNNIISKPIPPQPKRNTNGVNQPLLDALKLLLKLKANELNISTKTITDSKELEEFLQNKPVSFSNGFRDKIFGQYAQQLLDGKIVIKVNKNKLEIC